MRTLVNVISSSSSHVQNISVRKDVSKVNLLRFSAWNTSLTVPNDKYRITLSHTLAPTRTWTVPKGKYTLTSLTAALKTWVESQYPSGTAFYDSVACEFVITFAVVDVTINATPQFTRLFGLHNPTTTLTSTLELRFGGAPIVSPTTYYKLYIKNLTTYTLDYYFIINDEEVGGLLSFDKPILCLEVFNDRVNELKFELRDEFDELVDLRGAQWTAIVEIESRQ